MQKNDKAFIKSIIDLDLNLNKRNVYVIYCSGKGCSLSEDLGFYLYDEFKFDNILIYEGGMPEWIDNSLPRENEK